MRKSSQNQMLKKLFYPLSKACKELKVRPEEAMMVGDWPERDINGAKAVGMKTCFAKYGDFNGSKRSGPIVKLGVLKRF